MLKYSATQSLNTRTPFAMRSSILVIHIRFLALWILFRSLMKIHTKSESNTLPCLPKTIIAFFIERPMHLQFFLLAMTPHYLEYTRA